jgi:dTDP-4-amino-4,6-dideoxy-D-galactose acyltransferase
VIVPVQLHHASQALSLLSWDSEHFEFPVARIFGERLEEDHLSEILLAAQEQGVALVYWSTWSGRRLTADLLNEFSGTLVDQKVTFAVQIEQAARAVRLVAPADIRVEEWDAQPASDELIRLGIAAGVHSRFRTDPRIPAGKCTELYATWAKRSTMHELSDLVLVAIAASGRPAGLLTASIRDEAASIGLLAVDEGFRGRGIGSTLISRAHAWMCRRGAETCDVVTQLGNKAACRLYESCGYQLALAQDFYHFWVQEATDFGTLHRSSR